MIETMKPKVTLAASELQDGDIITIHKSYSEKEYVFPRIYYAMMLTGFQILRSAIVRSHYRCQGVL